MAVNISEARVKQVTAVVERLSIAFTPWSDTNKEEDFVAVLDKNIAWYDHGFYAVRLGHDAVLGLRKGFLHSNDPFRVENLVCISIQHL